VANGWGCSGHAGIRDRYAWTFDVRPAGQNPNVDLALVQGPCGAIDTCCGTTTKYEPQQNGSGRVQAQPKSGETALHPGAMSVCDQPCRKKIITQRLADSAQYNASVRCLTRR
jgi:hypothetical protein